MTDTTALTLLLASLATDLAAWAADNTWLAATLVSTAAAYVLYIGLGPRHLGPDDDYWPVLRNRVVPWLDGIARRYGLYAETQSTHAEFAGRVSLEVDAVERALWDAGYHRQPLASLHESPDGRLEHGSWAKFYGPFHPASRWLRRLPVVGGLSSRVLRNLDNVLALKQTHAVLYSGMDASGRYVDVYAHTEWNPLNPLGAALHYAGRGLSPAPARVREDLEAVGVDVAIPAKVGHNGEVGDD